MSRYIDADALKEKCYKQMDELMESTSEHLSAEALSILCGFTLIDSAPSIDIVRCQDCKYWVYNFNGCARNPCTEPWYATDYCNYGERKESE